MNNAELMTIAQLAIGDYIPIRNGYRTEVRGAVIEYLYTEGARITRFRNLFKRAIANYFEEAFNLGFVDAGGELDDMDPADREWLASAISGEFGFVDMLFEQMKAIKKEATDQELLDFAEARAEGYAKTLDGIYNSGKLRGLKGIMLTFTGPDGNESCSTCQRLKGKRHSAKWWLSRGLEIFRGNRNYECGNWQCEHFYMDDQGRVYTI